MLSRLTGQDLTFWLYLSVSSLFSWIARAARALSWPQQATHLETGKSKACSVTMKVVFYTQTPKVFPVMLQACFLLYLPHPVSSSG